MLSFAIDNYRPNLEVPNDLLTNHKDYDLDNFFLLNVSGVINRAI